MRMPYNPHNAATHAERLFVPNETKNVTCWRERLAVVVRQVRTETQRIERKRDVRIALWADERTLKLAGVDAVCSISKMLRAASSVAAASVVAAGAWPHFVTNRASKNPHAIYRRPVHTHTHIECVCVYCCVWCCRRWLVLACAIHMLKNLWAPLTSFHKWNRKLARLAETCGNRMRMCLCVRRDRSKCEHDCTDHARNQTTWEHLRSCSLCYVDGRAGSGWISEESVIRWYGDSLEWLVSLL